MMTYSSISRIILTQAVIICIISVYSIDQVSAQVGGVLACTNFTCRYGECEQLSSGYQCHCPAGIKGENCDLKIQPGESVCLSSPCWGGGTCQDLGNDYRCMCPPGRTGKNCRTIQSAPCLLQNPCKNNAVCQVVNNELFCYCVGFWTGKYCDTPIDLCSRPTPCYNGGTCVNNACRCPANFIGYQCETYNLVIPKKVVKVLNKGWYVADLKLNYMVQEGLSKIPTQQKKRIAINQDHVFYLPSSINYASMDGVVLIVHAIGGKQVVATRIRSDPECFHVWGTTLIPFWTRMPCW